MSDQRKTCDLCGWPIEEWQKRITLGNGYVVESPNEYYASQYEYRHANPADHRPTRKPEQPAGVNDVIEHLDNYQ